MATRNHGALKMVAAAAGVAPSTVSRALRGHPGISEATRKRVREAAERIGYTPDERLARFFREMHQGSRMIALVVSYGPFMDALHGDPFYARINWIVQRELQRRGHHMVLANAATDLLPDGRSQSVVEAAAIGVITDLTEPALLEPLLAQVPVVQLNAECPGMAVDTVLPNVDQEASDQVDRLRELGHRAIACFRPRCSDVPPRGWTWQDRRYWRAFEDRVRCHGLALPEAYLAPIQFGYDGHDAAIHSFLDRVLAANPAPTAVVTHDIYAASIIRQLAERGLQVPRHFSVMGSDDHAFGHPSAIPLSTFRQDFETMAVSAVDLLLQRIKEPARPPILIQVPGQVVLRESTAAAPDLSAAVNA